jgi:hypothetical protein
LLGGNDALCRQPPNTIAVDTEVLGGVPRVQPLVGRSALLHRQPLDPLRHQLGQLAQELVEDTVPRYWNRTRDI